MLPAQQIYFGPTIKSVGLYHKAVFRGVLPPLVQALIQRNPGFASLFVDLTEFTRVNHELKSPTSVSSQIYKHFAKNIK